MGYVKCAYLSSLILSVSGDLYTEHITNYVCILINIQIFWNAGCQLVALNFQTLGEETKNYINKLTDVLKIILLII
jgi:hypothetical protein